MSEPEVIRVKDMNKPPNLEDWQWSLVVSSLGEMVLAKREVLMLRSYVDGVSVIRPQSVMVQNSVALGRLRLEIQKQLGIAPVEGEEELEPWEQPADHWRS